MGETYTDAALRGFGDMDETYNNAALRGFGDMDETYNNAALRGFGDMDEIYNDAALHGFGSYTNAALKGCGRKLRKGSPEAKAFMARLRAMRNKGGAILKKPKPSLLDYFKKHGLPAPVTAQSGGKKVKGGIALSTVAAILGIVPPVIKGAHALYDWIKGSGMVMKNKGGRDLIMSGKAREEWIKQLSQQYSGRKLAARVPYTMETAHKLFPKRKAKLGSSVADYLDKRHELYDAVRNAKNMKKYQKEALEALGLSRKRKGTKGADGIVYPEGYEGTDMDPTDEEAAAVLGAMKQKRPKPRPGPNVRF